MPITVDIELGGTFPFPDEGGQRGFGNVRPLMRINGIEVDNPSDPVEAQLERAIEAGSKGFLVIDGQVVAITKDLFAEQQAGIPGLPARLNTLERRLSVQSESLKNIGEKLREIIPVATATVKQKGKEKTIASEEEVKPAD